MSRYFCLLVVGILCISGCASTTSNIIDNPGKFKYDSACVIGLPEASPEVGLVIKSSLEGRGIKTFDLNASKECPGNILVKYLDTWHWDIVMYLKRLKIQIIDNNTQALLADAEYETKGFHKYAAPKDVSDQLLNEVFRKIMPQGLPPKSDTAPSIQRVDPTAARPWPARPHGSSASARHLEGR